MLYVYILYIYKICLNFLLCNLTETSNGTAFLLPLSLSSNAISSTIDS